ncbi:hypothetical protein HDV00_003100 [Rhizophlyctis rosea]|nr:hypothetical protein HDV00_003100 [Rhizophlyctis rosea]
MQKEGEREFYVDVKYDGESKSRRNSTQDRKRSHDIIRAALGHPHSLPINQTFHSLNKSKVTNCILEGELLVYDEDEDRIEQFGGIRDFWPYDIKPNGTTHPKPKLERIETGRRHLMIAFFDVLYLNNEDLVFQRFAERRKVLQDIIRCLPKWAILSETRKFTVPSGEIALSDVTPFSTFYTEVISRPAEGVIVKGANSFYKAGKRGHWLKVKPDYQEGGGDSAEYAVIGGKFDPREHFHNFTLEDFSDLMNVFYIGCLTNKDEVMNMDAKPCFKIIFSFSAGFSGQELKTFCGNLSRHRVKRKDNTGVKSLPYDFEIRTDQPDFLFTKPHAVELKGGSFVQNHGSGHWTLRHPRLVRQCGTDRDWRDCVTYQELQEMGQASLHPIDVPENVRKLEELVMAVNRKHVQAGRATTVRREAKVSIGAVETGKMWGGVIGSVESDENTNPSMESYQTTNDGSLEEISLKSVESSISEGRKGKRSESPKKESLCASAVQSLLGSASCSTTTSTISVDSTGEPKRNTHLLEKDLKRNDGGTSFLWEGNAVGEMFESRDRRVWQPVPRIDTAHAPPLLLASSSGLELVPSANKMLNPPTGLAPLWTDEIDEEDVVPLPPVALHYDLGPTADDFTTLSSSASLADETKPFAGEMDDDHIGTIGVEDVCVEALRKPSVAASGIRTGSDLGPGSARVDADCRVTSSWDDVQSIDLGLGVDDFRPPELSSDLDFETHSGIPESVDLGGDTSVPTDEVQEFRDHITPMDMPILNKHNWQLDIIPPSPQLFAQPLPSPAALDAILRGQILFPIPEMCNVFVPRCSEFHAPLQRMVRRRGLRIVHGIEALVEGAGWRGGYAGKGWRCGMVVLAHVDGEDTTGVVKKLEEEIGMSHCQPGEVPDLKVVVVVHFDFLAVEAGESDVDWEEVGMMWAGHPIHGNDLLRRPEISTLIVDSLAIN